MSTWEHKYAEVTNNNDPELRGRIKVKCDAILAENTELPDWIDPKFSYVTKTGGWFGVPEVGTMVELEIPTSNMHDEFVAETRLYMADWKYVCTTYTNVQELPKAFQGSYPKRSGYYWPNGWAIYVDFDTGFITMGYIPDDAQKLWIKITDEKIEIATESDEKLVLDKSAGTAKMEAGGSTQELKSGEATTTVGASNLKIEPAQITATSGAANVKVQAAQISLTAPKVNLGAEVAVIPALLGLPVITAFTAFFSASYTAADTLGQAPADPSGAAAKAFGQAFAAALQAVQTTLPLWPSITTFLSS